MHAPSEAIANSAASAHLTLRVQCEAHDCGALLEVTPDAACFPAGDILCMLGQGQSSACTWEQSSWPIHRIPCCTACQLLGLPSASGFDDGKTVCRLLFLAATPIMEPSL